MGVRNREQNHISTRLVRTHGTDGATLGLLLHPARWGSCPLLLTHSYVHVAITVRPPPSPFPSTFRPVSNAAVFYPSLSQGCSFSRSPSTLSPCPPVNTGLAMVRLGIRRLSIPMSTVPHPLTQAGTWFPFSTGLPCSPPSRSRYGFNQTKIAMLFRPKLTAQVILVAISSH